MTALAAQRFAPADRVLKSALRSVQLLAHLTPSNFEAELARLRELPLPALTAPDFVYRRPRADIGDVRGALERAAVDWERLGEVGELYAARARELALEGEICEARGTSRLPALAASRFDPGPQLLAEADALADAWLASGAAEPLPTVELIRTDDTADRRSLICRLRAVLGDRRLGARVVVSRTLAPLAAVGDGVVQIAMGRLISVEDVERTVLHEIEGHVMPMERATRARIGLFAVGSAQGSDQQEGWALLLERRAGFLRGGRRIELALRHKAARAAHASVPFAQVVNALADGHPQHRAAALRAACRAFRGGGLGRELAYLPALLRVERSLASEPELERALTAGRLSVDAARVLARHPAFFAS